MAILCTVPTCDRRKARSNGLCNTHNYRLEQWGDVAADVPVKEYGESPYLGTSGYMDIKVGVKSPYYPGRTDEQRADLWRL